MNTTYIDLCINLSETLEVTPDELRPETRLESFDNWDSLAVVELIGYCDEHLGVRVVAQKLASCATVGDILALLEISARADPE